MATIEERESFVKLIRVLEDAIEEAAKVLGSEARPSSRRRHQTVDHAYQIYENLCDLLDESRAGLLRLEGDL
jgi:hypothetical protein